MRVGVTTATALAIVMGCGPAAFAGPAWDTASAWVCGFQGQDRLWAIDWDAGGPAARGEGGAPAAGDIDWLALPPDIPDAQPAGRPRARAFEYSRSYEIRRKIHKYASFATIPLFVAEYAVGQKLYNGTASESARSLHGGLAGATGVLFGVNSVTGVWNLWEGRKDPNGRTRRMIHGILMLGADAGFVATGMLAPDHEEGRFRVPGDSGGNAGTHRAVALTSMGVALASYLMMLFWRD